MKRSSNQRSKRGQGIIEGTVGTCMIFSSGLVASVFLLNSGTSVFFKDKLSHSTYMATQFAAAHQGDSNLQSETEAFVTGVLPQMGLKANDLKVAVKQVSINDASGVQVTITNTFPVYGGVRFVPSQITLSDSECHIWTY